MTTDREILVYLRRAKDDPDLAAEVLATMDESGHGAALLAHEVAAPFVPVPPVLLTEVAQLRNLAHRGWLHEYDGAYSISRDGEQALDEGRA